MEVDSGVQATSELHIDVGVEPGQPCSSTAARALARDVGDVRPREGGMSCWAHRLALIRLISGLWWRHHTPPCCPAALKNAITRGSCHRASVCVKRRTTRSRLISVHVSHAQMARAEETGEEALSGVDEGGEENSERKGVWIPDRRDERSAEDSVDDALGGVDVGDDTVEHAVVASKEMPEWRESAAVAPTEIVLPLERVWPGGRSDAVVGVSACDPNSLGAMGGRGSSRVECTGTCTPRWRCMLVMQWRRRAEHTHGAQVLNLTLCVQLEMRSAMVWVCTLHRLALICTKPTQRTTP